jgi:DNA-binding response OmpR family regulator
MRVLIADDDPACREFLRALIGRWHFEIVAAADGVTALRLLQDDADIAMALLAWRLPAMDGYEVCRQIRSQRINPWPYILLSASNHDRQELIRVFIAGADDYVLKPFDALDLQIRIRAAFRVITAGDFVHPLGSTANDAG